MFHQINDSNRKFYTSMPISVFKKLCEYINSYYEGIHVSEIQNHFINSSRPAAIITFDDGHFDILENALPILSNLNMKFTINIDTEIIQTRKPQDFVRVWDILNQVEIDNYFNQNEKIRDCEIVHSSILSEIFFETLDEIDCENNS